MKQRSDIDYALTRLRGIIGEEGDPDRLIYFIHDGAPVSKSRARWSRKTQRFYTPEGTRIGEEALAWSFKAAMKRLVFTENVAIVAVFYRPNFQRIDSDNLMKLVLDAGTRAGAWIDDCHVTAQASFMELDRTRPRTVVALCPATSSLDRTNETATAFTCGKCGLAFTQNMLKRGRKRVPRFCSQACAKGSELAQVLCPKCNISFRRGRAGQRYCSEECQNAARLVRQPRANQRPPSLCLKCGAKVSRREYTCCAKCSPKGRKLGSKNKPKPTQDDQGERVDIEIEEIGP